MNDGNQAKLVRACLCVKFILSFHPFKINSNVTSIILPLLSQLIGVC